MTRPIQARVWVLRRPALFTGDIWYVQQGGICALPGPEARETAHEYPTLKAAKTARLGWMNYGVWRRGRR